LLSRHSRLGGALAVIASILAFSPGGAAGACNPSGGLSAAQDPCAPAPQTGETTTTTAAPGAKARLVDGTAIAPAGAPPAVKQVIEAANRIRTKPYLWGGGHGRWWDTGYDCSGAISYALRGASLITSPLNSTGFLSWGEPEAGRWISVYANAGHAYAVIAGLRWDTAGSVGGTGPRWYASTRSVVSGSFMVRHPPGY
jgi:cell wall-associated NlpC family hydrolase